MQPSLQFRSADVQDIPMLRDLAERIWRPCYAAMLPAAQIDYMLERFYAPATIAAEMAAGTRWELAVLAEQPVGFLALSCEPAGRADLHKLYLLPDCQGLGLGQRMLDHAKAMAADATDLRLRVNKANARAIRAYGRAGFQIVAAIETDIGGGFTMDDYVMARSLHSRPLVKICGLSTVATIEAVLAGGAGQIGLVFFPKSPRHVSLDLARDLAGLARGHATIVALTVDADDAALDAIMDAVSPDWLQLHGRETPARVAAVRLATRRPVMKAIGIAEAADLAQAEPYRACADRILFDAKPPRGAALPGGNGIAFDWPILRNVAMPYMLSGGLTPATVATALAVTGAQAVDVSSGVETVPGLKDPGLIAAFVASARQVGTPPAPGLAAPRGLSDRTQSGDPS